MDATASPLIDANGLQRRMGDPNLRVADVRWYLGRPGAGRDAYEAGHIPGAVFVDLDADLADPNGLGTPGRHPLPSPADFARRMGELGVGSDDLIVAYDDAGGTIAARLWWMLESLGHRGGARVLDGGFQAWTEAGYELSREQAVATPATIELGAEWTRVIERSALADPERAQIVLDARAPERYRGDVEPIDPQAGHIPGAFNAPTSGNLDSSGRLRSHAELHDIYSQFDLDVAHGATVVSCGSGVTACHAALAMRVAGLPDPVLYVGSFSDWSRSGLPVTAGTTP